MDSGCLEFWQSHSVISSAYVSWVPWLREIQRQKPQFWELRGRSISQGKKRELSFRFPWSSGSPLRNHSTDVPALFLISGTAGPGHAFKMQQFLNVEHLMFSQKERSGNLKVFVQTGPNWLADISEQGKHFCFWSQVSFLSKKTSSSFPREALT